MFLSEKLDQDFFIRSTQRTLQFVLLFFLLQNPTETNSDCLPTTGTLEEPVLLRTSQWHSQLSCSTPGPSVVLGAPGAQLWCLLQVSVKVKGLWRSDHQCYLLKANLLQTSDDAALNQQ